MRVALAAIALAIISAAPTDPIMELQSEALTPGLVLGEMKEPIHQVRLLVDIDGNGPGRGTLVLDPNTPEFDDFGRLVGGIVTPQVSGNKRGPLRTVELTCDITFVKEGPDKWLLFRLTGPKITSTLFVATRGSILEGGPARLVVIDKKVKSVVDMTRYGLAIP